MIRILYIVESSLTDFSLGALWDDTKAGFSHLQDIGRVALVSDHPLVRGVIHAFHFLLPRSFEVFPRGREGEARAWVSEGLS
jgi:hypothetical protein